MSHFTQIDIEIRDTEALRTACDELGLTLKKNAEARGFGGNHRKGEYVIKLKGPYDIALNSRKDGIYKAETDLWEGHVENELGPGMGRLKQLYAVHKTTREARRKGYTVRRMDMPDRSIRLQVTAA